MLSRGRPALIGAFACFLVFFANVAVGAAGGAVFLSDVLEMLVLFAAVLFFVAGVLVREAQEGPSPSDGDGSRSE